HTLCRHSSTRYAYHIPRNPALPRTLELIRPCRAPGLRRVGMCVALPRVAMLLSELTIIYLAAAAPFGVARFVEDRERGTGALARSAAAALAWPATALLFALRSVAPRTVGAEACDDGHAHDEQRVERVRRSTVNALREVEDLLLSVRGHDREDVRHALFAARESVERYAGLAL